MLHCSKFAKMIALKLLLNNARAGDNPRREMSLPVSCLIRAAVTEVDSAMLLWLGAAVGCHVANSSQKMGHQ